MFAVIETGGKQYRVTTDSVIRVEKIAGSDGSLIEIDKVLMLERDGDTIIGNPVVQGAKVVVEIIRNIKDKKVIIFKKIRRHNYRRKRGHRQMLSLLKVKEIVFA
jgi:large subunit ribosomal protein L21